METVFALLSFVDHGHFCDTALEAAIISVGPDRMRLIAIKILGWMKSQHRLGRLRSLKVKPDVDWGKDLHVLIVERGFLSGIVTLSDGCLTWSDSLTVEKKLALLTFVSDHYNPPLMTGDPTKGISANNAASGTESPTRN